MIEPNENIFKYVQSKHVCGILGGLIGSLSMYICPDIIEEAIAHTLEEMKNTNGVFRGTINESYKLCEKYRGDYDGAFLKEDGGPVNVVDNIRKYVDLLLGNPEYLSRIGTEKILREIMNITNKK
jgi:hypothetical protein